MQSGVTFPIGLIWPFVPLSQITMRNKDDRNEFKEQQDAEIMDAYRRIFNLYGGHVGVRTLYEMVSFAPASRFFVSARQAYRVISRMLCGAPMPKMRPTNLRMYNEILARVKVELSQSPHNSQFSQSSQLSNPSQSSIRKAVAKVVRQPAPEMYVGIRQVSYIISKEKRKCYEERKRRLRHCF